MLDAAFDALKTYNWGADRKVLEPIDEAVITTREEAPRKALEERLAAVLKTEVSRDAKDYVCRKLMFCGSAASVPALASLLGDKEMSHMARFALERIPGPESSQALRDGLAKAQGVLKAGIIGSLGSRKDSASVPAIAALVGDADAVVARSAALALGAIRGDDATKAAKDAKSESQGVQSAVIDSQLACAEGLLAQGKKADALAIYKALVGEGSPKHIKLAATRGMLACAGK